MCTTATLTTIRDSCTSAVQAPAWVSDWSWPDADRAASCTRSSTPGKPAAGKWTPTSTAGKSWWKTAPPHCCACPRWRSWGRSTCWRWRPDRGQQSRVPPFSTRDPSWFCRGGPSCSRPRCRAPCRRWWRQSSGLPSTLATAYPASRRLHVFKNITYLF